MNRIFDSLQERNVIACLDYIMILKMDKSEHKKCIKSNKKIESEPIEVNLRKFSSVKMRFANGHDFQ